MTRYYWLCEGTGTTLAIPFQEGDTEAHISATVGTDRMRLVSETEARDAAPGSPCFFVSRADSDVPAVGFSLDQDTLCVRLEGREVGTFTACAAYQGPTPYNSAWTAEEEAAVRAAFAWVRALPVAGYQVWEYGPAPEGEHILTTHSYEEAIEEAKRVIPLPGTESRIVTDGDGRKVAEYQAGDPPVTEVLTKGRLADATIATKGRAIRARLAILDGSDSAGMWSVAIYGDGEAAELIAYQGVTGAGKAKALWSKNRERYEAALKEWGES